MGVKTDKNHVKLIKEVQKELEQNKNIKLDYRVVDFIATHPFLFTSEKIRDPEDERAIRHRYLCIIAIMRSKKKKELYFNETTN